ncbi:hypothetical protein [Acinetobacter indicus]|uniref:hypothetical protein n=1 Tax=Acinetobacter indicus TaxID=756892 RepID=UPI00148D2398|nr:hypothetical protein [Acinetobacter indicus]NOJ68483.1 hypothetical protein [Acinetobacter indicus]
MSVYQEMVSNLLEDPMVATMIIAIFFSAFLVVFIIVYNKIYIKKHRDDFLNLYYGTTNVSKGILNSLDVTTFFFLTNYDVQLILNNIFKYNKKNPFPSIRDKKTPMKLTPNAYIENIDKFRKNHNRWMFINWIINFLIILTFAVFILIDLFYKR